MKKCSYTPQIFWNIIPSPLEAVTVQVAAKDYEAAKAFFAEYVDSSLSAIEPLAAEPQKDASGKGETAVSGARTGEDLRLCVSCGQEIPEEARLCPNCGWTQPGF